MIVVYFTLRPRWLRWFLHGLYTITVTADGNELPPKSLDRHTKPGQITLSYQAWPGWQNLGPIEDIDMTP